MARTLLTAISGLARHRLLQFVVGGGALFALSSRPADPTHLALDGQRLDALVTRQASRHGRPATDPALRREVLAQVIDDELLVREARRLGLDQDDAILRRRLIQKTLFLAEDLGGASRELTEPQLQAYFAEHRHDYRLPARARFHHVVAAAGTDGEDGVDADANADAHLRRLLPRLGESPRASDLPTPGHAPTGTLQVSDDDRHLQQDFGAAFVAHLWASPLGKWSGPVRSKVGLHLVFVDEREPERLASYEEARDRLRLDVLIARRQAAVARFLEAAHARYQISLDGQPLAAVRGAPRTAAHYAASVED